MTVRGSEKDQGLFLIDAIIALLIASVFIPTIYQSYINIAHLEARLSKRSDIIALSHAKMNEFRSMGLIDEEHQAGIFPAIPGAKWSLQVKTGSSLSPTAISHLILKVSWPEGTQVRSLVFRSALDGIPR